MSKARLVANRDIIDGSITDTDVNASAAIAATKLSGVVTPTSADTLGNKTLLAPREVMNAVTNAPSDGATVRTFFDVANGSVLWQMAAATMNTRLDIRWNSTTTLNSVIPIGGCITVTFMLANGATAYYFNEVRIDNIPHSVRWQGGTAPTAGNANSIDAYTFTLYKGADAAFSVFGSVVKFA